MTWLGLSPEQVLEYVGFLLVAGVSLVSALGVLFAPRVLHAAVWLLFALLGVAGVFALLGAHLLFAVQVLVYAGAIAVMIIFAVVLLERGTGKGILAGNRHLFAGLVGAGAFAVVILLALVATVAAMGLPASAGSGPTAQENVRVIGRLFLTRHILAFELISVVLLASMIGAIVLARAEGRDEAERGGAAEADESGAPAEAAEEAEAS